MWQVAGFDKEAITLLCALKTFSDSLVFTITATSAAASLRVSGRFLTRLQGAGLWAALK